MKDITKLEMLRIDTLYKEQSKTLGKLRDKTDLKLMTKILHDLIDVNKKLNNLRRKLYNR